MIASMTGFARREVAGSWGTLTCELRSVNHRYLEPGFRLPEELRPLESDLRQLLAKHLKRGKVDCTMHLRGGLGAERELRVDAVALEDSPTGVAAAKAAGLTVIGVPSHPGERLAAADHVVDSLTELLPVPA